MSLWMALIGLAWALPPDATPGLFPVGNGKIGRIAVSTDGSVVVGRDLATNIGFVLFVEDWSTYTTDMCEVTGMAVVPLTDATWDVWIACGDDGTLRLRNFDGDSLDPVYDSAGAELQLDLGDSLSGVWYHPDTAALYALSIADTNPTLHVIDPISLASDADVWTGYPLTIAPWTNFNEGVISGSWLIIHHADDNMTGVTLGSAPAVVPSSIPSLAITVSDIAPSLGGVYAVDTSGFIAEYIPSTQNFQLMLSDLTEPEAVMASLDTTDPWLVVTGQQIKVWEMTETFSIIGDNDDYYWASAENLDNHIQDGLVYDGYLYGGGEGGNLNVSTARPWVYPKKIVVEPSAATEGDVVSLTFDVDSAGTWEVFRGGDRYGTGVLLATGEATEAQIDTDITVDLTVTGDWEEGDNRLYVILTTDQLLSGHASTTVDVDNPPDPPSLNASNLAYSDGALQLSFEGISDADLDHYVVYVSTTPFSPGDWETGGPEYDGTTKLKAPISVTKAGGESVDLRIQPLENEVVHYVAVRAWDQGGLEGAMSRVISETPRPSYTASGLAGEEGGSPCSTSPRALGVATLVALGAVVGRRRRLGLAQRAAAASLALALIAPSDALAQQREKADWGDLTKAHGDFELKYGVIDLEDEDITSVYDKNPSNLLQIEAGPQFARFFEVDLGFGFFQELSQKVDSSGLDSADKTMLTWWPLALDATLRLHLLDEQFLVPHAKLGADYIIWSEKWDDGLGDKDVLRGAKTGYHWALGGGLLLDTFSRRRASMLEAQTGINDTWLVIEWRDQSVDSRKFPWSGADSKGLDFSGRAIMAGIKLDY